ncbi:hypothetical protein FJ930_05435 [Mesorhizobium sp. B2-4-15]|uniref:hypothetical protein n=1 Tax=Mesorhizobium sp. B2-4-15 TaxID=2589934 RepID=UPI00114E6754|nr:hypothetical protein [Mesorhizobium sp. B2-4-15]TPK75534.1 hypothetical protein FJ930_05435 [Mesorhizobium sp. B2-4-15]
MAAKLGFLSRFRRHREDVRRIIISGTGRAGTTYLVELLTELGLDTGEWSSNDYFPEARAGLERGIFDPIGPRIIKSPFLCENVDAVLAAGIKIDHVVIPVRRFEDAAASRVYVQEATTGSADGTPVEGGLWETGHANEQIAILYRKFANLIESLLRNDIPMTLISFPRSAIDPQYLFGKLSPLIPGTSQSRFQEAFSRISKPSLIHQFEHVSQKQGA